MRIEEKLKLDFAQKTGSPQDRLWVGGTLVEGAV